MQLCIWESFLEKSHHHSANFIHPLHINSEDFATFLGAFAETKSANSAGKVSILSRYSNYEKLIACKFCEF